MQKKNVDKRKVYIGAAIGIIDMELDLQRNPISATYKQNAAFRWTGSLVEFVELIYALDEMHCINDGENGINELTAFFGSLFGLEIKDNHCYNAYADMKRRKNESRTYFLDKLQERLNLRMRRDDERELQRR